MSELQEVKGVGNTVEEKLIENGIETVSELANTPLEELNEIGIRSPEKILNRAQRQSVLIEPGEKIEREQNNATYVSTSIQAIDEMLGGGLQGGYMIGVSGESKAGKTQFVLQCLAAAADYTDKPAVYIETEPNRFQIDRVKSLTRKDDSHKNIYKIDAYDHDETVDNLKLQRNAYDAVKDNFDEVSLVVVDSFIANFRLSDRFNGREDLPERNSVVGRHLEGLQSLSNHFDCPILMTLQVQGNPDAYSGGNVSIWGPVLMDHTITYLLHMSHAKGELKEASLKGHPGLPDDSVTIKIPENAPLEAME